MGVFFLKHGVLASRTCCTGISPFILPSFLAFSTTAVAQTIGTKYLFSDDFILSMTNCSLGSNSPAVDEQQLRLSQKCMIKVSTHRRNHGVQWVHLHPLGGELNLGVIHTKKLSAAPAYQVHPRRSKSQFLGQFLLCQENLELEVVVLDRLFTLLEATTKKGRQLFHEKVHHRTKSWLPLCFNLEILTNFLNF